MSLHLTADQIDAVSASHDGDLLFHCDACEGTSKAYRQGEDGLTRVNLMAMRRSRQYKEGFYEAGPVLEVDLCRKHLREFGAQYVTWGASFCSCGGIVDFTGNTRPIKNGDGVWQEHQCEYFNDHKTSPMSPRYTSFPHFREWEPLD